MRLYFQTQMSENRTIRITMMKNWVSHILFLRKGGCIDLPERLQLPERPPKYRKDQIIQGMSLKFVDSLPTAQHKQLLVFSTISL